MNVLPTMKKMFLASAILGGALSFVSASTPANRKLINNEKPIEIKRNNAKENSFEWNLEEIKRAIDCNITARDEKELAKLEAAYPERARHFRYNKNATVIQNAKQASTVVGNNVYDYIVDPLANSGPIIPLIFSAAALAAYAKTSEIELAKKGVFDVLKVDKTL